MIFNDCSKAETEKKQPEEEREKTPQEIIDTMLEGEFDKLLKEEPETQPEALESEAETEAISTSTNVSMVKLYSEAFQNIVAKPEPHWRLVLV